MDDWAGCCHNYCKPVAKFPYDREALRAIVKEGNPKFFLGTDSAPHPRHTKETSAPAAGVFTSPLVLPYVATILESFGALDKLQQFACENGRAFYKLPARAQSTVVKLVKENFQVPTEYKYVDDEGTERSIVPFMAGKSLKWRLER